jgi:hypothetical protein
LQAVNASNGARHGVGSPSVHSSVQFSPSQRHSEVSSQRTVHDIASAQVPVQIELPKQSIRQPSALPQSMVHSALLEHSTVQSAAELHVALQTVLSMHAAEHCSLSPQSKAHVALLPHVCEQAEVDAHVWVHMAESSHPTAHCPVVSQVAPQTTDPRHSTPQSPSSHTGLHSLVPAHSQLPSGSKPSWHGVGPVSDPPAVPSVVPLDPSVPSAAVVVMVIETLVV